MTYRWVKVVFLALAMPIACAPSDEFAQTATDVQTMPVVSNLTQSVLSHPNVITAKADYDASQLAVGAVAAGGRVQLGANVMAGRSKQNLSSALVTQEDVATAEVNASLLLSDGGQLAAQMAVARADGERAGVQLGLVVDQVLAELAMARVAKTGAEAKIKVIQNGLARYEKYGAQIDAAFGAGILTNAEYAQVRLAQNEAQSQLLQAQSTQVDADVTIALALMASQDQRAAQAELDKFLSKNIAKMPTDQVSFALMAERLGILHSAAALRVAQLANRPRTQLVAAVSAPSDDMGGVTGFAGVRIAFSIYDGGAAQHRAKAQARRVDAAQAREQSLNAAIAAQDQRSQAAIQNAVKMRALLQERLEFSRARLRENEGLLMAGRADIVDLAQTSLAIFEAELALANLDSEMQMARLARYSVRGAFCDLFEMCNTVLPTKIVR